MLLKIKDNQLFFDTAFASFKWHEFLKKNEGAILVVDKLDRDIRTPKSNSLYWVIVTLAADYTGLSKNAQHEVFRTKFIPLETVKYRGGIMTIRKSTAAMTKKEFSEYLNNVIVEVGQLGVIIPLPDDYKRERDSAPLKNETHNT